MLFNQINFIAFQTINITISVIIGDCKSCHHLEILNDANARSNGQISMHYRSHYQCENVMVNCSSHLVSFFLNSRHLSS